MKRAYKYRFYPTPDQAELLNRTFGCVRKVYNLALELRTGTYVTERRSMTYVQSSAALTQWKKTEDLAFLNEVSSVPLQQALRHLQSAFASFFAKRAKYPRFKSKRKSRQSAEFTRSAFRWHDGRLTLAKMDAPLDIVWSRPLPDGTEPSTVTVSRDPAGRWHVSIFVEAATSILSPADAQIGVDVGLIALLEHPRRPRCTAPLVACWRAVRPAKPLKSVGSAALEHTCMVWPAGPKCCSGPKIASRATQTLRTTTGWGAERETPQAYTILPILRESTASPCLSTCPPVYLGHVNRATPNQQSDRDRYR